MEPAIKEKVSFLEENLNRFIIRVNEITYTLSKDTQRLKNEMREFKGEMSEFKNEMKDFKEESRRNSRELDARLENLSTESKISLDKFTQETDIAELHQERKERRKKWCELADRLGTFSEDIVAPNIPRIAQSYFGAGEVIDFAARWIRRDPTNLTDSYDFDSIIVTANHVFLLDCKFTAKPEHIERVPTYINHFKKCFTEYDIKTLIPIFASMSIPDHLVQQLTDMGIYAMAMGDDNMDLVNFEAVQNRA